MSVLAVTLLICGLVVGLRMAARRRTDRKDPMSKPPHEPGIARRLKALQEDGILVAWRDKGWFWWESAYHDGKGPPPGSDGPFHNALTAIKSAESFRRANPA